MECEELDDEAEYELWVRIHARELAGTHGAAARELIARLSLLELSPLVLARALEPFPVAVRTLDALHLASLEYLRSQRLEVSLATSLALAERIPDPVTAVAESGIRSGADLRRLSDAGFDACLVGEHLMSAPDPGDALRRLLEEVA